MGLLSEGVCTERVILSHALVPGFSKPIEKFTPRKISVLKMSVLKMLLMSASPVLLPIVKQGIKNQIFKVDPYLLKITIKFDLSMFLKIRNIYAMLRAKLHTGKIWCESVHKF